MYDVLIIGGGASGVFAAIHAARFNKSAKIAIVERNDKLMRKLSITGKGRCNLTNNCDIENMMRNIPKNGRFLYSALSSCNSYYIMNFFEELGVSLKTERGGRVFPVSDKAADIVIALKKELERLRVGIINDRTKLIMLEGGNFNVSCENNNYKTKKVIIAAGGVSYPKTGSTGDGYVLARKLGHNIITPKPSLVPVTVEEDVEDLAGLSLKNVEVSLYDRQLKKIVYKEQGEMIFTHTALSGPLILTLSSYIPKAESSRYIISIDLKPALDEISLDKRLLRDFSEIKNKWFINSLNKILPQKLIPVFIKRLEDSFCLSPQKQVNEITREERQIIIKLMKNFNFSFSGFLSPDCAVITDGGVDVREINPKTMESKFVTGLHFCGEVIDVSGLTGGFNLQIAFSTAYVAAASAAAVDLKDFFEV